MHYIGQLRSNDMVSEIYLCKEKRELKTKAGKNYYDLTLQDKTGTLDAKIWDLNPGIEHFEALDFVKVEGSVTTYQGSLQLNVRRVRRAREGEYIPADYMPCSRYDIDAMYKELLGIAATVREPHLHALLEQLFVKDKALVKSFKDHSAAKSIHHGFVGGLLEHTLSVAKLCDFYASRYPLLNRDLLLTAAICHDIGKTKELSLFPANDYTDEGQLIGHIVTGVEIIGDKIRQIPGFPEEQIGKRYEITVVRGIQKDVIPAAADEPVAVALERAAIPVDTHCRGGECGFCRSQLLDGDIFVSPLGDGRRAEDKEMGWFHACSAYPMSDLTVKIPIL